MSRLRWALVAVAATLGLGAGVGACTVSRALSPVSETEQAVPFVVSPGTTLSRVARDLEEQELVRRAWALSALARWRGVESELRAGEYELAPNLSAGQVLDRLVEGRVRTHRVAIPEGLTAVEIADRLHEAGLADRDAFLAVVRAPDSAEALGVKGDSLEGFLFPETYQLARGLEAREVVDAMVGEFLEVWAEVAPKAKARGLTLRQTVTLASIVEKETGAPEERPRIAAVFHNRLERGMRLETDPTVIYGIPDFDGNLRRVHLEDASNPYNTYRIPGLPPGPIANPGADALRAVVEPEDSDFLFFVSKNDGTHHFSKTYGEHLAAVNRYQLGR